MGQLLVCITHLSVSRVNVVNNERMNCQNKKQVCRVRNRGDLVCNSQIQGHGARIGVMSVQLVVP